MRRTSSVFIFNWSQEMEELQLLQMEHLGTRNTHTHNLITIIATAAR